MLMQPQSRQSGMAAGGFLGGPARPFRWVLLLAPLPVLTLCIVFWWWPFLAAPYPPQTWPADWVALAAVKRDCWLVAQIVLVALAGWYGVLLWPEIRAFWQTRHAVKHSPREEWLNLLAARLRPALAQRIGRAIPRWPVRYDPALNVGGLCAYRHAPGGPSITIGPASSVEGVAYVLAHEWLHAALPAGVTHGAAFQHLEARAGFGSDASEDAGSSGYWGRSNGDDFRAWSAPLLAGLPPLPAETGERPAHPDAGRRWVKPASVLCAVIVFSVMTLPILSEARSNASYFNRLNGPFAKQLHAAVMASMVGDFCMWLDAAAFTALFVAALVQMCFGDISPVARFGRGVYVPTPGFLTRKHFHHSKQVFVAHDRKDAQGRPLPDFQWRSYNPSSAAHVGMMLRLIEQAGRVGRDMRGLSNRSPIEHSGSVELMPSFGFVVDQYIKGGERLALVAYGLGPPVPARDQSAMRARLGTTVTLFSPLLTEVRLGAAMHSNAGEPAFTNLWARER